MTHHEDHDQRLRNFMEALDKDIDQNDEKIRHSFYQLFRVARLCGIIFSQDIRGWYKKKRRDGQIPPWWSNPSSRPE